jgi:hypothetical protein
MVGLFDWLFSQTDNINLIIEVSVGLFLTAWVAGMWSKHNLQMWLTSEKSDPYIERVVGKIAIPKVPTVEEVATEVGKKFPVVPTVEEIAAKVRADLPDFPTPEELSAAIKTELEPIINARISAAVANVAVPIGDVLMPRLQALMASKENQSRAEIMEAIAFQKAQNPGSFAAQPGGILDTLGVAIGGIPGGKRYKKYIETAKALQQVVGVFQGMQGGMRPGMAPGYPGVGHYPSGPSQMDLYRQNQELAARAAGAQQPNSSPRPPSAAEVEAVMSKLKAETAPPKPEEAPGEPKEAPAPSD